MMWRLESVAGLPCPHNLFKCQWAEAHQSAIDDESDNTARRRRAFETFARGLTPNQIANCQYHRPDWHGASETACGIAE
jgi:hypothetical protein